MLLLSNAVEMEDSCWEMRLRCGMCLYNVTITIEIVFIFYLFTLVCACVGLDVRSMDELGTGCVAFYAVQTYNSTDLYCLSKLIVNISFWENTG